MLVSFRVVAKAALAANFGGMVQGQVYSFWLRTGGKRICRSYLLVSISICSSSGRKTARSTCAIHLVSVYNRFSELSTNNCPQDNTGGPGTPMKRRFGLVLQQPCDHWHAGEERTGIVLAQIYTAVERDL